MKNLLTVFCLSILGSFYIFPASSRQITSRKLTSDQNHATGSSSLRRTLSSRHATNKNPYQSKTRKRHLRKKKQYILAGLGAGLGTGLAGYGYDYGSLAASNNPVGYAAPNVPTFGTQGAAALGTGSLLPSATDAQQRQNLLGTYAGADVLGSYSNAGLGSYSNAGINSYSNGAATTGSLTNGGMESAGLANGIGGGYETKLANDLTNSLSSSLSNGLTSKQMSGISALSSYSAGSEGNSYDKGLSSLLSSSYNPGGSELSSLGGKYDAASLSAGLDTPNGISNIANLLSSASTSFDADNQNQMLSTNNGNLNSFGQRFGNHLSGGSHQLTGAGGQFLGGQQPPYGSQQSTLAEAQAFNNQLSHLSAGKINLGSHSHANYGGFNDNMDSNSLNEIGQIASTGISDASLQRLLGQLMAGQLGHTDHGASPNLGNLPSDASVFEQGNSEQSESSQLEDQEGGFLNHQLAPLMHGQTVHAHASDRPKAGYQDEVGHSSAAKEKAAQVQQKANEEHRKKLKELKERLKILREKLRKLKSEYDDDDEGSEEDLDSQLSSELTEKSELDTLDDLKKATEEAIKELQKETLKVAKAKGLKGAKKLIFIHKYPQSSSHSDDVTGKKKGGEPGTELLEVIEDESSRNKLKSLSHDGLASHKDDETESLTDLEKQAEQEVNFLTNKSPKVIRKQRPKLHKPGHHTTLNPGLHIHIPEPIDEGESYSQIKKPKLTSTNASGRRYWHFKHRPKMKVSLTPNQPNGNRQKDIHSQGLDGIEKLLPAQSRINENPRRHDSIKDARNNNNTSRAIHKHSLGFFSIGCWRDQPERALPSLEGIFPILDGNDYMHRKFSIRKCAQVARVQGFYGFAIENGGHCLGGKNILQTYSMYGPSRACRQDGKGGPWSMEVYKFTTTSMNQKSRRGDIIRAAGLEDARDIFFSKGHNN